MTHPEAPHPKDLLEVLVTGHGAHAKVHQGENVLTRRQRTLAAVGLGYRGVARIGGGGGGAGGGGAGSKRFKSICGGFRHTKFFNVIMFLSYCEIITGLNKLCDCMFSP